LRAYLLIWNACSFKFEGDQILFYVKQSEALALKSILSVQTFTALCQFTVANVLTFHWTVVHEYVWWVVPESELAKEKSYSTPGGRPLIAIVIWPHSIFKWTEWNNGYTFERLPIRRNHESCYYYSKTTLYRTFSTNNLFWKQSTRSSWTQFQQMAIRSFIDLTSENNFTDSHSSKGNLVFSILEPMVSSPNWFATNLLDSTTPTR